MKEKEAWDHAKYIKTKAGTYRVNFDRVNPRSVYLYQRVINHYAELIQNHAAGLLLDCGCGFVPYYELYKDLVDDNFCVDWENSVHKNPFLDKIADLNEPLPFPDKSFDTVLLTDVLEHIAEPFRLIGEISRILKPQGKLIMGVPFFYWIHEAPYDYYRYTEFLLRKICTDNNLEIVSIYAYGGYPDIILDLINKYVGRNKFFAKVYLAIANTLGNNFFTNKLRERWLDTFPLGYCLVAQNKM